MSGINMDASTEALIILAEECCEVGQITSKILRWGLDSTNHGSMEIDNRQQLIKELGDVLAMIGLVQKQLDISDAELEAARQQKLAKLKRYSRHF
jgi:NTP pyrophosphatase (non-canonical NTP hydrolase)